MSRIVWFHPRQLFPPRGGGDHRSAGLVRGALAAGHEVLLVQPYDGLPRDAPPAGLRVVDLTPRQGAANALAKIVETATITDGSGNVVDLKNLRPDGSIGEPEPASAKSAASAASAESAESADESVEEPARAE